MILRGKRRLYVALLGGLASALVATTFLVPWYGIDYYRNGDYDFRLEYSLGFDEPSRYVDLGGLMMGLVVVMVLSLIASINATILPLFGRIEAGKVASIASAELLLASAVIFYIGAIETGHLDHFSGYTTLNRTVSVETEPLAGWWILVAATIAQTAQVAGLFLVSMNEYGRGGISPREINNGDSQGD